jgi:plasmid maintenance system antidote protein VapI
MVRDKDLHPIHSGEVSREELLKTYKLTPQQLAKSIKVEERIIKELTQEQPKTRKRKLLTDPGKIRIKCKVCLEVGNLENLIRH